MSDGSPYGALLMAWMLPRFRTRLPRAEALQKGLPPAEVVKRRVTMNHQILGEPACVPGEQDVFLCGGNGRIGCERRFSAPTGPS